MAFTPKGSQPDTDGDDGTIRFWDVSRKGKLVGMPYAGEPVRCTGFLPRTDDLVTARPEGWLRILKLDPVVN